MEREVGVKYFFFGNIEDARFCSWMSGGVMLEILVFINIYYFIYFKRFNILFLILKYFMFKLKGLRYYLCS